MIAEITSYLQYGDIIRTDVTATIIREENVTDICAV